MSKETLKTLILEKFPDNTSQEISPEDLRVVQEAVVDEMALEQKISELPKATGLKNEAQFIIEQDGQELSLSGEQLKEFVGATEVVQEIGDSTEAVMSQKAVTTELGKKVEDANYVHTDNNYSNEDVAFVKELRGEEVTVVNQWVGVGTSTPLAPWRDWDEGRNSPKVENIIDTISPFKGFPSPYITKFSNVDLGASSVFTFGNTIPNKIKNGGNLYIQMWMSLEEIIALGDNFFNKFKIQIASDNYTSTIIAEFTTNYYSALNGNVETSLDNSFFTASLKIEKINEVTGWGLFRVSLSNIILKFTDVLEIRIGLKYPPKNVVNYWGDKSLHIANPQVTFDYPPSANIQTIPDIDGVTVLYPTTPSGYNATIEKIENDIKALEQKIGEYPLSVLVDYENKHVEVTSKLSDNYSVKNTGGWQDDDSYTKNPCWNFRGTDIIKNGITTRINGEGDNISATGTQYGWMAGNHGEPDQRKITASGHGLTYADIGTMWKKNAESSFDYMITAVYDENTFGILCQYTMYNGYLEFRSTINTNDTITNASGKVLIATLAEPLQWYPSEKIISKKLLIDGVEIKESGTYEGESFDFVEVYDVYDPIDYFDKIKAAAGTLTANPLPRDYELKTFLRYSNDYRFQKGGQNVLYIDWISLDAFKFTQFFPLNCKKMVATAMGGTNLHYYLPKALAVGGNETTDYRIPKEFIDNDSVYYPASSWENPDLPPDRAIEFLTNSAGKRVIGFHHGYIFDQGIGGTKRKDYLNNGWWTYNQTSYTSALEPCDNVPADMPAGKHYSFAAFRKYEDVSVLEDGLISVSKIESNNALYLYIDVESVGSYDIDIPTEFQGKILEVFEKSSNIEVLSSLSVSPIRISVSESTPMYAYAVIKINK